MPRSLRSPKHIKRRRWRLTWKIVLVLVIVLLVVGGPAYLSHARFLTISTINVVGNSVVTAEDIQKIAADNLQGNYAFIFSKSNVFLYPRAEIAAAIMAKFLRIQSVDVRSTSLSSAEIGITERKPTALWCPDAFSKNCFFLDSNGLIFDSAPDFSTSTYFIYTGRLDSSPLGESYLPADQFTKMQTMVSKFSALGLIIVRVDYETDDSYSAVSSDGGKMIFSLSDDPDKVASNLESVLNDSQLNVFQNGTLTVSSIDLRYGNKVIVRKKGA